MRAILLFLFALSSPSYAATKVLTYEPAIVELTGTLDLQTFPGPPNYESIEAGDEVERHFYLNLDAPVDVLPPGKHVTAEKFEVERNVRIMQLAINAEDDTLWARFRKVGEGGRVRIKGTLFHRFTGHHHSRVLLAVNQMEPIRP